MLWRKPSGKEIETNDSEAVVEYCLSLGWEPIPTETKQRRRRGSKDGNSGTNSKGESATDTSTSV